MRLDLHADVSRESCSQVPAYAVVTACTLDSAALVTRSDVDVVGVVVEALEPLLLDVQPKIFSMTATRIIIESGLIRTKTTGTPFCFYLFIRRISEILNSTKVWGLAWGVGSRLTYRVLQGLCGVTRKKYLEPFGFLLGQVSGLTCQRVIGEQYTAHPML